MRWTSGRWRILLVLFAVLIALASAGRLYYQQRFPYGWSHSCDLQLMSALYQYAEEHDKAFPAGELTPEASLSLLYPAYANEYILQGKTVPIDVVKGILENGERLGPNTCGWHYVEGLRLDDDPRLALFWDKVGLGHNGERLSDGGRTVFFVDATHRYIAGCEWQEFLEEQYKLQAERKQKLPGHNADIHK
jgi:hypothetical protein